MKEAATVWSLSALFLSLSLPQIKISVIKLIKVTHANMPHGSRPDFVRHTVVESCRSSTFDVAFCIIENNWIPPPLPHTHIHFAHVHSGYAQLIDLLRGSAESPFHLGVSGSFSAEWGPGCV